MKKIDIKWYDKGFHFAILAVAGVLMFAGVMSLIPPAADIVVRYALATVVVGLTAKELW